MCMKCMYVVHMVVYVYTYIFLCTCTHVCLCISRESLGRQEDYSKSICHTVCMCMCVCTNIYARNREPNRTFDAKMPEPEPESLVQISARWFSTLGLDDQRVLSAGCLWGQPCHQQLITILFQKMENIPRTTRTMARLGFWTILLHTLMGKNFREVKIVMSGRTSLQAFQMKRLQKFKQIMSSHQQLAVDVLIIRAVVD